MILLWESYPCDDHGAMRKPRRKSEDEAMSIEIRGGQVLKGEVTIGTAKNAVLPILAASLLSEGGTVVKSVPKLTDVLGMYELMRGLGARIEERENDAHVDARDLPSCEASYEWVQRMRASVLIMGPLLARLGKVRISLPGGCAIGTRPIDLHLKGFAAMGASIASGSGFVEASAAKLRGGTVYLDTPSVGATENIMMAAVLADGVTRIENSAKEPEIVDLACFLNEMGARVRGAGDSTVLIEGVTALHSAEYRPIPDRIEAGTMMILAAATGGNVLLRNVRADHLRAVIAKLTEAGARVSEYPTGIRVRGGRLSGIDIKTLAYPGFPTDLQAPMMAMLCHGRGTSVVNETIFENRFMHVAELRRMGAQIHLDDRIAVIEGVKTLSGAHVIATDLRAGAALVVAAAMAEGTSLIDGVRHIDRGYERLEDKLRGVGCAIRRTGEGEAASRPMTG